MPLNDYRKQVTGSVDLDVMNHCANRYGVSLTAAILKWLSYTDQKAVVIMSIDGYMKWAWSSQPAFKRVRFIELDVKRFRSPQGLLRPIRRL